MHAIIHNLTIMISNLIVIIIIIYDFVLICFNFLCCVLFCLYLSVSVSSLIYLCYYYYYESVILIICFHISHFLKHMVSLDAIFLFSPVFHISMTQLLLSSGIFSPTSRQQKSVVSDKTFLSLSSVIAPPTPNIYTNRRALYVTSNSSTIFYITVLFSKFQFSSDMNFTRDLF